MNGIGPRNHAMNKHGSGMLSNGTDVLFCNAVLVMSIDTTEL
jgi:hypothetical protein